MSTVDSTPLSQDELAAIKTRLTSATRRTDDSQEAWTHNGGIASKAMAFVEQDVPRLLAEVERLRSLLAIGANYLESAASIILDDVLCGDDIDGDDVYARDMIRKMRESAGETAVQASNAPTGGAQ